jgi:hypothetical protein
MSDLPLAQQYRLDFAAAVVRAYRVTFANWRRVIQFAWLPLVLELAIFGGILAGRDPALELIDPRGDFDALEIACSLLVQLLAVLVFLMIFLARWYVFLLLGDRTPPMFPRRRSLFVHAALKVGAVSFIGATFLSALPDFTYELPIPLHIREFLYALISILGIVLLAFAIELSLIFPAAAIGQSLGLREAWALLLGNHWRLFFAVVIATLFFIILVVVCDFAKVILPSTVAYYMLLIIDQAMLFVLAAAIAALLCEVYRSVGGPWP